MPLYNPVTAGGGSGTLTTIEEVDANPTDNAVTKLVFPNGTLGIAAHVATYTAAGGGSSGALVFLEAHTASTSAQLDFTTFISGTYDTYQFEFVYILPATNNVDLVMRMSTDGGSTYDSGSNYENMGFRNYSGGSAADGGTGQTSIMIASTTDHISNDANHGGVTGFIQLFDPGGSQYKRIMGVVANKTGSTSTIGQRTIGCAYISATAVNAVRFLMSSGNITSGTIRVYGVSKT